MSHSQTPSGRVWGPNRRTLPIHQHTAALGAAEGAAEEAAEGAAEEAVAEAEVVEVDAVAEILNTLL